MKLLIASESDKDSTDLIPDLADMGSGRVVLKGSRRRPGAARSKFNIWEKEIWNGPSEMSGDEKEVLVKQIKKFVKIAADAPEGFRFYMQIICLLDEDESDRLTIDSEILRPVMLSRVELLLSLGV